MVTHRKVNKTGRSSGKLVGRQQKNMGPPKGEPWVWLTRTLVSSDAWRMKSRNVARLIDFLLTEHMNHAAQENGNLMATYHQLVAWGLPRSEIRKATLEAEFLGLIRVTRGGRLANTNRPSTYHLTFLPMITNAGVEPPKDHWKSVAAAEIREWREKERQIRKSRRQWKKNQNAS